MDKIVPALNVMEMTTRVITRVVKEVEENKKEFPGKEKQILALSITQGFLKELGVNIPDEEILRYIDSVVGLYNALGLFQKKRVLSKAEWEATIIKQKPNLPSCNIRYNHPDRPIVCIGQIVNVWKGNDAIQALISYDKERGEFILYYGKNIGSEPLKNRLMEGQEDLLTKDIGLLGDVTTGFSFISGKLHKDFIEENTRAIQDKVIKGEIISEEVLKKVSPLDVAYYGQEEAIERAKNK